MHILYIADGDSKYGALNSLLQLASEMKKISSSIKISVVLTRRSDRMPDFQEIGCDVYRISYVPFLQAISYQRWKIPIKFVVFLLPYLYGRIFGVKELERKLNIKEVDIIHSNSSREDFGAMLSQKHKIPLVWHIREFSNLHYQCFSYRKNDIPFMNETATEFIAISEAVKEQWIQKGLREEKFVRIYNGVKENGQVKGSYPKAGDILRFVIMGALNEPKGQHHIINAIASLPEKERKRVRLDIVGDGSTAYTKKLKRSIQKNNLTENVRLLGYQKDFYKKLSQYDCGVMCSKCEGFGRVSVEYMMAGLPVIASDTGANPEIIEDSVNGLLYKYEDVEDLTHKISYLLNHEARIEELGRNAYRCAAEKYTASINAANIYQEYKKILKGREN